MKYSQCACEGDCVIGRGAGACVAECKVGCVHWEVVEHVVEQDAPRRGCASELGQSDVVVTEKLTARASQGGNTRDKAVTCKHTTQLLKLIASCSSRVRAKKVQLLTSKRRP